MSNEADGKFVVVQGGQRVSGKLHEQQGAANAEADKLTKKMPVVEASTGKAPQPVKVVKNLLG
jgi:hypothetical protein